MWLTPFTLLPSLAFVCNRSSRHALRCDVDYTEPSLRTKLRAPSPGAQAQPASTSTTVASKQRASSQPQRCVASIVSQSHLCHTSHTSRTIIQQFVTNEAQGHKSNQTVCSYIYKLCVRVISICLAECMCYASQRSTRESAARFAVHEKIMFD